MAYKTSDRAALRVGRDKPIRTGAGRDLLRKLISEFSLWTENGGLTKTGTSHNAQYYLKKGAEWSFESDRLVTFYGLSDSTCIIKLSNWGGDPPR
jgi:hypothetical protein